MEAELDTAKNARQNLNAIYSSLKELKAKRERISKAILQTQEQAKKQFATKNPSSEISKSKIKKEKFFWWSQYRSFETSGGLRAIAGKNAKQNDELYAKHLEENDLFFHADIQGAPTTLLKGGANASESDLFETAQWAACFSSAWKVGAATVDVYAVKKEQVAKNADGGYVGRGAFAISGQRQWFRATPLLLKIGFLNGQLVILPFSHKKSLQKKAVLSPGSLEKEQAAKKLSAYLSAKADDILGLIPSGGFGIKIEG
ncbi:MAG: NFACT RNA binding domain-containing protein [Candidatus Micrarchaeia archaeon]